MSTMTDVKDKFYALPRNEQKILVAGITLLLVFILYSLLYKPMSDSIVLLQKSNMNNQQLLAWMNESVASLKSSSTKTNTTQKRRGRNLNVIINTSASSAHISISRSQPRDNKQYQIWLDQVVFNDLLHWLKLLQTEYGIFVSSINLGSTDNKGEVRVNLTFQDLGG